ncbi:MAG: hypothetical protein V1721_01090 [Pseudomonadota bacterium]
MKKKNRKPWEGRTVHLMWCGSGDGAKQRVENTFGIFCKMIPAQDAAGVNAILRWINEMGGDPLRFRSTLLEIFWWDCGMMCAYRNLIEKAWQQAGGYGVTEHMCDKKQRGIRKDYVWSGFVDGCD